MHKIGSDDYSYIKTFDLRVWWLSRVHLVDTNDHLLDTEGEGKESVFAGLTVLGDTSFEFTDTSGDDQDSAISLDKIEFW